MSNIFELVEAALATISPSVPYALDELITEPDPLPDTYLVYHLITGVGQEFADNEEISRTYRVQVDILCTDGLASLPDVDTAMRSAGFTKGPERELSKDSTTSHFGLAKDYFYLM
jgi:hypothetical protein